MVSYWIGIGVIRHSHVGSSSEVSEGQDPKSFRLARRTEHCCQVTRSFCLKIIATYVQDTTEYEASTTLGCSVGLFLKEAKA